MAPTDTNGNGNSDLRGSSPALSSKQVLDELRCDMKRVVRFVDIMEAANLPARVDATESWQDKWAGRVFGLTLIGSSLLGIVIFHIFSTT